MSESTRYRIVVGIDFSEISSLALDAALDTARHSDRPELHVVAVVDDAGHHLLPAGDRRATIMQTMDHVRELLSNDTRNALARQLARHAGAPTVNTIIHVRLGAIPENLAGLKGISRTEQLWQRCLQPRKKFFDRLSLQRPPPGASRRADRRAPRGWAGAWRAGP